MTRFPGGPATVLCAALAVVSAACASSPHRGAGSLRPTGFPQIIASTALSLRGTPYRNGGSDPSGFDCSGFTQYVFERNGIALPREVDEQYRLGKRIQPRDLTPGDLVFFKTVSRAPSHVGIVVGDDEFIHAPSSRGVVRVERLSADYWSKRFVAARRIP